VKSDGTTNPQCGLFYPNFTPKCWDNSGNYDTQYHTEPDVNGLCYANNLQCASFTNNNCNSGSAISGQAEWYSSESEWDIMNCECGTAPFTDNTEKFCIGVNSGVKSTVRWIDYVTDQINYNSPTGGYYCTRCIHDNGNTKYYANTTFSDGIQCSPNTAQGRVCKCETTDEKGYWRQGECNTDTNWENNNQICKAIPCNPGKTTNDVLPISEDDSICNFGSGTQLCDDAGCISLDGLGGVPAPNWTYIE
jgi:hypothetical protein